MSSKSREILNIRISAGSRTLYVDLKEKEDGTRFLSISEVRRSSERDRVVVDEEYVADLHRALGAVLELLDRTPATRSIPDEQKPDVHSRAYSRWTREEDRELKQGYIGGQGIEALARQHGRAPTAILSRLYQLGVLKITDKPRWE
jgi:hypothetical protein